MEGCADTGPLVQYFVELGLRRFTVACPTRDALLLAFVNTKLMGAGLPCITAIELVLAMRYVREEATCPLEATQRYPPQVRDFLQRASEREHLRAESFIDGGDVDVNDRPVEHFLKTQQKFCQVCEGEPPLPAPSPTGKVAVVYDALTTTTARLCTATCATCKCCRDAPLPVLRAARRYELR